MEIVRNGKLAGRMVELGLNQKTISEKTGIARTLISMAVCGRYNLTVGEKEKIASALSTTIENIFPEA